MASLTVEMQPWLRLAADIALEHVRAIRRGAVLIRKLRQLSGPGTAAQQRWTRQELSSLRLRYSVEFFEGELWELIRASLDVDATPIQRSLAHDLALCRAWVRGERFDDGEPGGGPVGTGDVPVAAVAADSGPGGRSR